MASDPPAAGRPAEPGPADPGPADPVTALVAEVGALARGLVGVDEQTAARLTTETLRRVLPAEGVALVAPGRPPLARAGDGPVPALPEHVGDRARFQVLGRVPVHVVAVAMPATDRTLVAARREPFPSYAADLLAAAGDLLALAGAPRTAAEPHLTRDLLLAAVSHELKTPLTVIMGALRTLEQHGDTLDAGTRTSVLDSALRRGHDLERLIDRLLQGARADLASEVVRAHLPEQVAQAVAGFETVRDLRVGDVPDVVLRTDRAALQSLLGVLLENAVAHSPPDTPVEVTAGADERWAWVGVRNVGRLPPDVPRDELFTPFRRGGDATSSGVGLGLFIAQRLAAALGGSVHVDEERRGGSRGYVRFSVRLPLQTASPFE